MSFHACVASLVLFGVLDCGHALRARSLQGQTYPARFIFTHCFVFLIALLVQAINAKYKFAAADITAGALEAAHVAGKLHAHKADLECVCLTHGVCFRCEWIEAQNRFYEQGYGGRPWHFRSQCKPNCRPLGSSCNSQG